MSHDPHRDHDPSDWPRVPQHLALAVNAAAATQGRPGSKPLSLKARALRLLAAREYSRSELARKLEAYEDEPGAVQRVLDELQGKGFLNEQRVVDSVVYRRAPKLGAQRIRQELQRKGLPAQAVAQAVQDLQSTELERAHEVWRRKFPHPAADPRERVRQMRFLAARGFGADVIRRVVAGLEADE